MNVLKIANDVIALEIAALKQLSLSDSFCIAIETLEKRKSKVITSGIGKAGFVGARAAVLWSSIGMPSFFVHPSEAVHGDFGMVEKNDVVFVLSNSGESIETNKFAEYVQQKKPSTLIGITRDTENPMASLCNSVIEIGRIEEPCPLKKSPTASLAVMTAVCDAIGMVMMRKLATTATQYKKNHPGGAIGLSIQPH